MNMPWERLYALWSPVLDSQSVRQQPNDVKPTDLLGKSCTYKSRGEPSCPEPGAVGKVCRATRLSRAGNWEPRPFK